MKRVVSVSLGSSKRDKRVEAEFFGTAVEIERIGTDGDKQKFRKLVSDLDGKVDAFGVGGCDIYLYAGDRRYTFREPLSWMAGAKQTPFVDGSGLKHTLEREAIGYLQDSGAIDFRDKRVLIVSAVDRFGMAEALAARARSMVFGDLMFGLGIPIAIRSWTTTQRLARLLLPVIVRAPFDMVYPTGEKQEHNTPKYTEHFKAADVIAGDFHYIRRYMPPDMAGKTIITNTTTVDDVAELGRRGVEALITTTPVFEGRSFGTNVMEAVLVALLGKRPEELTTADYLDNLKRLGWMPQIQRLDRAALASA